MSVLTCPNAYWQLNAAGTACIPIGVLLTCGSTQATITLDVNHLYADLEPSYWSEATIEFGTCNGTLTPDNTGHITESFDIHTCGGHWSQSGNIIVDFEVKGSEDAIKTTVGGVEIILTSVLHFDAHCEYSSEAFVTTEFSVHEDDVTAEEVEDTGTVSHLFYTEEPYYRIISV